ncbi:MAG: hypothetical protein JSU94_08645 [Phycisphaerales bacterium]|nr:MAG: hypothetical protein JSU94_08645 [Phycisphaerales bacterium]
MRYVLAVLATLAIIYVVPFVFYGISSMVWDMKPPSDVSPAQFLLGILVSKTGTAIAFVLIYHFGKAGLGRRWVLYAFIWWLSFAIGELGQAIGPGYTWKEAVIGVVSEAVYFPLAAVVTMGFIGATSGRAGSDGLSGEG